MFFLNTLKDKLKGYLVNRLVTIEKRKELENKIVKVFENDMNSVPVGFRKILANDLMSAFENRINAFNQAETNLQFFALTEGEVQVETIKTRNLR
jgi:hypothetical protein